MLMFLVYLWIATLSILLVSAVCALFVMGGRMVREDKEKQAMMQAEKPKEIEFDGPSRYEVQRTVNRLLREDRKRPTRRMEWRVPNV